MAKTRATIGRNDKCYCGSGKKYKACHLPQDEKRGRGAQLSHTQAMQKAAAQKTQSSRSRGK